MTGRDVAVRSVPVPAALQDVGVRVGQDAASGMAIVLIPAQVRERFNVLDPVQSFAQADPNWSPAIRVVELDPNPQGQHFYANQSWGTNRVAPTKQALELLAKAGGVLYTRTDRVARDQLAPGETFAYRATIGVRRSDGTIEEVTREKGYEEEAEREEIVDAVRRAKAYENGQRTNRPKFVEGTPEFDAEVRKRWLQEQKYAKAKTESKAILRAIRAAFQVPQQISVQEAGKPWLVVGYSFTPDTDDAEVKRILVAQGFNAGAAIYGPQAERPALPVVNTTTGEIIDHDEPASSPGAPDGVEQAAAAATRSAAANEEGTRGDGEPSSAGDDAPVAELPDRAGASADANDLPFGDGTAAGPNEPAIDDAAVAAAAKAVATVGQNKGKTVDQLEDAYLLYVLRNWSADAFRAAVETYTRAERPEAWATYIATREAQA